MKACIVLEGGSSRGFFTTGVLDCFLKNKIYIDNSYGSSMGAVNSLSYIARQEKRFITLFTENSKDHEVVSVSRGFSRHGDFVRWDYLEENIFKRQIALNMDEFHNNKSCNVTITNAETGELEIVDVTKKDNYEAYVRASTALPPIFQVVEIDGIAYSDGGIADPIPYEEALTLYDKVVIVRTRERTYHKEEKEINSFTRFICRKKSGLIKALNKKPMVYNKQVEDIKRLEDEGKVFVIYPDGPVTVSVITRDKNEMMGLYNWGYRVASENIKGLKEFLEN